MNKQNINDKNKKKTKKGMSTASEAAAAAVVLTAAASIKMKSVKNLNKIIWQNGRYLSSHIPMSCMCQNHAINLRIRMPS